MIQSKMLLQVHDELIRHSKYLCLWQNWWKRMENAVSISVPLDVEIKSLKLLDAH